MAPAHHRPRLVVLAASAGGFPVIMAILSHLPREFPAAVAVVLHRSTTTRSIAAELFGRRCRLPVHEVHTGGEPIQAGHVYLAPPDRHLIVTPDRCFDLLDGVRIRHVRSSANPLFESAAEVYGPDLVAIVLSGGDSDATDGVQTVHARGGYVIAQSPESARIPAMPTAAIHTGTVDAVLPVESIAPMLVRLLDGGAVPRAPGSPGALTPG